MTRKAGGRGPTGTDGDSGGQPSAFDQGARAAHVT